MIILLVQLVMTVVAWSKGWRSRAVWVFVIGEAASVLVGFVFGLLGYPALYSPQWLALGDTDQLFFIFYTLIMLASDIAIILVLTYMIVTPRTKAASQH
jgi:hypothetical protein